MVLPRLFNATSRTAVNAARSSRALATAAAKHAHGKVRYVFFSSSCSLKKMIYNFTKRLPTNMATGSGYYIHLIVDCNWEDNTIGGVLRFEHWWSLEKKMLSKNLIGCWIMFNFTFNPTIKTRRYWEANNTITLDQLARLKIFNNWIDWSCRCSPVACFWICSEKFNVG